MDDMKPGCDRLTAILLTVVAGVALAIRLFKIDQPFVDAWSWRQADVAMIAENFYRRSANILYPRINWAGSAPGYVGTEFPLVPGLAALLYVAFGVQDWIGRSISLAFFGLSLSSFSFLLCRLVSPRVALFAVTSYALAPLSIFASRAFIPDMAALALSLTALALAAAWFADSRRPTFIALCVVTTLAVLVKLPSILVGLPILYLGVTRHGPDLLRRREPWILAGVVLLVSLAWYGHALRTSLVHPPYHIFGSGGIGLGSLNTYQGILREAVIDGLTPVLSTVAAAGALCSMRDRSARVFHCWLLALLVFVLIAAPGHRHPWYVLPLVPVASVFAAFALEGVVRRCAQMLPYRVVLAAVSIPYVAVLGYAGYVSVTPLYHPRNAVDWQAGLAIDALTPADALIITVDWGDPTTLYYSRRRGWHFLTNFGVAPDDSQGAIAELQRLVAGGARYLVFTQRTFWWLENYEEFRRHVRARYPPVRETSDYVIFDLTPGQSCFPHQAADRA